MTNYNESLTPALTPKLGDGRYPDGNPKTAFGTKKPPIHYIPGTALLQQGLAHLHGHLKYGHFNWRDDPVTISTYLNAATRHLLEYKEGSNTASDSHIHHLAHVCACCNILMDAEFQKTLIDDRHQSITDYDRLFKELEPTIAFIHDQWGPKGKAKGKATEETSDGDGE